MKRRIVQIAAAPAGTGAGKDQGMSGSKAYIACLCNDGTLWTFVMSSGTWCKEKPIPQDEPAEEPGQ